MCSPALRASEAAWPHRPRRRPDLGCLRTSTLAVDASFTSRSRDGRRATCITHHAARPLPTATAPSLVRRQSRQRPVGDTFARGFRRGSVLFGGLFGRVAWRSFAALALQRWPGRHDHRRPVVEHDPKSEVGVNPRADCQPTTCPSDGRLRGRS